jgi:hypothetical protein
VGTTSTSRRHGVHSWMKPTPRGLSSQSRVRLVCRTANAVTFDVNEGHRCRDHPGTDCVDLYDDPAAVLRGFDLGPCRRALTTGDRHVFTQRPDSSMTTASYPVRSERWTMSSTARIIKYTIKGFQAYVPGLIAPFSIE